MRHALHLLAAALLAAHCGSNAAAPDESDDTTGSAGESAGAPGDAAIDSAAGGGNAKADGGHAGAAVVDSGPRTLAWTNVTNNLRGLATHNCGSLINIAVVPGRDKVIAGVANGGHVSDRAGLWATTDGGATWSQMSTGPGSEVIDNNPYSITFDPDNPDVFWESGQYGQFGVYKTTDGGVTFHHLEVEAPGSLPAVDFGDPARKTIVVGTWEQSNKIWLSTDAGDSWDNIGWSLPAGTNFSTNPVLIDRSTYVVTCSGWGSGTNGTYRTTDSGGTWTEASTDAGIYPPLLASDGTIYWPLPWSNGLIKSTDKGVSWTKLVGYNVITSDTPIELPDHRLVAVSPSQQLVSSSDHGATWKPFLDPIPIQPVAWGSYSVVYDEPRNSIFVSKSECKSTIPEDVVWRYDLP